jgi:hypothetical protein
LRPILAVFIAAALLSLAPFAFAQADKTTPDVLIFTNGDQLTGKLERATAGNVVFKSDMAGELTISFDKIKELRSGSSASQFAILRKGAPLTRTPAPEGTVAVADGNIVVAPAGTAPITVAIKDLAYLIDKPTYDKAIAHKAGALDGWNGAVNGGATIVRSSQNGTTLSVGANLVRAIPMVPYLPARNRTSINVAESYGELTTVAPPPALPPVKSNIFHADAERDEYFSPRLYALADVSFDHNFSQGLQVQQVYGGGIGWTPIQTPKQQLDVKADVHYERQRFIQPTQAAIASTPGLTGTPEVSLFGSTFAESYRRTLPRKLIFLETGNYLPGWTDLTAYSANVTAALTLPVYKRLNASISTTDNYLNNPAVGFQKNSYQFITGVTYTLH